MNVTELAASIYNTNVSGLSGINSEKVLGTDNKKENTVKSFEQILSSVTKNQDNEIPATDTEALEEMLDEIISDDDDKIIPNSTTEILTDAQLAKEYLESRSGRNLIVSMAENEIAGIISGNN